MTEGSPRPIWETLPMERQRNLLLALGQMAMRQILEHRRARCRGGTADDDDRRGSAAGGGGGPSGKIVRRHRERLAIVYIRQSTVQQVERSRSRPGCNTRWSIAPSVGWARETIVVIDDDLGRSGATVEGRLGFQRLVAEVGLGHVGLVLGIEMSRLARSCRDWHQLLEICALFDTLIGDADGIYDPANYNDRLLLGLKGTMSEAELHILKARMLAGRRPRRGAASSASRCRWATCGAPRAKWRWIPTSRRRPRSAWCSPCSNGSARWAVMRYLVEHDIRMPVRTRGGPGKGELAWHRVNRPSLYNLFANPIYAGAYAFGVRATDGGGRSRGVRHRPASAPCRRAEVFLPDRVPAYISWEQFGAIRCSFTPTGRRAGPVRAGSALLSGLVVCGRCGLRMAAHYNNNGHAARYSCAP